MDPLIHGSRPTLTRNQELLNELRDKFTDIYEATKNIAHLDPNSSKTKELYSLLREEIKTLSNKFGHFTQVKSFENCIRREYQASKNTSPITILQTCLESNPVKEQKNDFPLTFRIDWGFEENFKGDNQEVAGFGVYQGLFSQRLAEVFLGAKFAHTEQGAVRLGGHVYGHGNLLGIDEILRPLQFLALGAEAYVYVEFNPKSERIIDGGADIGLRINLASFKLLGSSFKLGYYSSLLGYNTFNAGPIASQLLSMSGVIDGNVDQQGSFENLTLGYNYFSSTKHQTHGFGFEKLFPDIDWIDSIGVMPIVSNLNQGGVLGKLNLDFREGLLGELGIYTFLYQDTRSGVNHHEPSAQVKFTSPNFSVGGEVGIIIGAGSSSNPLQTGLTLSLDETLSPSFGTNIHFNPRAFLNPDTHLDTDIIFGQNDTQLAFNIYNRERFNILGLIFGGFLENGSFTSGARIHNDQLGIRYSIGAALGTMGNALTSLAEILEPQIWVALMLNHQHQLALESGIELTVVRYEDFFDQEGKWGLQIGVGYLLSKEIEGKTTWLNDEKHPAEFYINGGGYFKFNFANLFD